MDQENIALIIAGVLVVALLAGGMVLTDLRAYDAYEVCVQHEAPECQALIK